MAATVRDRWTLGWRSVVQGVFVCVSGALLIGCDQDPFSLSYRQIDRDYYLNNFETGNAYYLVRRVQGSFVRDPMAPYGVLDGSVNFIGWKDGSILVQEDGNGGRKWVLIDTDTHVKRVLFDGHPLAVDEASRRPEVQGIRLRSPVSAWDSL